ncbi:MAG TPA: hypothetical protein VKB94_00995 [Rhizomicrobium sp.]|nr:hypothetical protein [Rhizomicrobium sp.]
MEETLPEITENRNDVSVTVQMLVDEGGFAAGSSKTATKPGFYSGWGGAKLRRRSVRRNVSAGK